MRTTLRLVPVLLSLLCLALPVWGEVPSTPPSSGETCPSFAAGLPALQPPPFLATTLGCGPCSDPGCYPGTPGVTPCDSPDGPGTCFGLAVGGHPLICGGGYQCVCLSMS